MSQVAQTFYGKYRGRVVDADDPLVLGRVRVQVPDVLGLDMVPWALPCVPMTHPSAALLALPDIGTGVWVEFEQGNPNHPIWTGRWWDTSADVPPTDTQAVPVRPSMVIQTTAGQRIVLADQHITIEDIYGNRVILSGTGISITSAATIQVHTSMLDIRATSVVVNTLLTRFSGVVQADTLIADSVIASSYTPGAGNIL